MDITFPENINTFSFSEDKTTVMISVKAQTGQQIERCPPSSSVRGPDRGQRQAGQLYPMWCPSWGCHIVHAPHILSNLGHQTHISLKCVLNFNLGNATPLLGPILAGWVSLKFMVSFLSLLSLQPWQPSLAWALSELIKCQFIDKLDCGQFHHAPSHLWPELYPSPASIQQAGMNTSQVCMMCC